MVTGVSRAGRLRLGRRSVQWRGHYDGPMPAGQRARRIRAERGGGSLWDFRAPERRGACAFGHTCRGFTPAELTYCIFYTKSSEVRQNPTLMRALVRGPDGSQVASRARPALPSEPGWARVRLQVAGLCRTDVYAASGQLPCAPETILGHEASGEVRELSPGSVWRWDAGTLVAFHPYVGCGDAGRCRACHEGRFQHCDVSEMLGVTRDGVFAEEVVVPLRNLVPLPGVLDARIGAFLEPLAAALGVLQVGLLAAEPTLVLGEGRVATLCAFVLAQAGFDQVVLSAQVPGGRSFSQAIETRADAGALRALIEALRPGGKLVLKSRPALPIELDLQRLVQRDLRLHAVSYGSFERAAAWLASGEADFGPWLGELHSFESFSRLLRGGSSEARPKDLLSCTWEPCAA